MILQEIYNHQHKLANVSLGTRSLYIFPALILALATKSIVFHLIIIVLFLGLTKHITRIPSTRLFRLYRPALIFVLLGCLIIAISFNSAKQLSLSNIFSFDNANIALALQVLFRSLAILSISYFGLLTHTISEITEVMQFIRVPKIFIELFVLTYKFIFNLLGVAKNLRIAQKCRLAYSNQGKCLHAFTLLISAVFRKAIMQSVQMEVAMESRLGTDELNFLSPKRIFHKKQLIAPIVLFVTLLISSLTLMNYDL